MMSESFVFENLIGLFEQTQAAALQQAARSVNTALVARNWLFGWYIVEFEDGGAAHADLYGKKLITRLSETLKARGGDVSYKLTEVQGVLSLI